MRRGLAANRSTPRCEDGVLIFPDSSRPPIIVGSVAWYIWLEDSTNTIFYMVDGELGCTIRREPRRATYYWYAYMRYAGRLHKRYLGRAAELGHERLRAVVHQLRTLSAMSHHQKMTQAAAATHELLAIKYRLSPPHAHVLPRSRLTTRLDAALSTRLTLLSAPAGYGKTSLLVAWLAAQQHARIAWLALDSADNDPARFWRYVLASFEHAQPGLINEAQALLADRSAIEAMLTGLLNRLLAYSDRAFVLAIDDYHHIEADTIHAGMTFLIAHAPAHLHVILALRSLAPLPLAGLRARGQLTELNTADLRLTPTEATSFLTQTLKLSLADTELMALMQATEGWFVGVQLLALTQQQAATRLLSTGQYTQGNILDYMAEEIFARLTHELQTFLLDTAVLDRLCAALCDAVRDNAVTAASQLLDQIEHANLFLVALDTQRQWFRYHNLFTDFLRTRLMHTSPERALLLHGRAARWFASQHLLNEAIAHALAAHDHIYAASLIPAAAEQLIRQGEVLTLGTWIEALPHALVRQHVWLCLWYAWVLALTLRHKQVEHWLLQVEQLLRAEDKNSESDAILGQVEVVRTSLCASLSDLTGTIQHAQAAQALLPQHNGILHAVLALNLGTAYLGVDDLTAAARALTEALSLSQSIAHSYIYAGAAIFLGQLRISQGRVQQAVRIYHQAQKQLGLNKQQVAFARVGIALSAALCERDDLAEAEQLINTHLALVEQSGYMMVYGLGCLTQARIHWAHGQIDQAHSCLDQAGRAARMRQSVADMRLIEAWRARLWLAQGQLAQATQCLAEAGLSWDHGPRSACPFEYVVLAELELARARADGQAAPKTLLATLEQLYQRAHSASRQADAFIMQALLALAYQACGNLVAARGSLHTALTGAAHEGLIRSLAELGPPLAALIIATRLRIGRTGYMHTLLKACQSQPCATTLSLIPALPVPEQLSPRQSEVLALIAHGLTDAEIAQQLGIAVGTARWHSKHILAKLGVNNRTQAALLMRKADG